MTVKFMMVPDPIKKPFRILQESVLHPLVLSFPIPHLCTALEIPELDVAIADRHKVAAVVAEAHGHHFGADLIRGDLHVGLPVEHVHDHVVLGANRHQVLAVGREGLCHREGTLFE